MIGEERVLPPKVDAGQCLHLCRKPTKSILLTVEGYFKPEEWTDKDGVKHNRIVMVANKFYPTPDKEEAPAEPEKKTKKGKK